MKLLVFAHRGEAQVFIKEMRAKSYTTLVPDVYQTEACFILITGEGVENSNQRVSAMIAAHHDEIDVVINYGIAGALSVSLEKQKIYPIRSSYNERRSNEVQFKSFSSEVDSIIDCISSIDRIIDNEQRNYLDKFAQVVDRELWGIASAADLLNKPFFAFKLISDFAGSDTACFDIKHQAELFSQLMFDHFQSNQNDKVSKEETILELDSAFYATVSQQRSILSLLKKCAIKEKNNISDILNSDDIVAIKSEDISPKKRTSKLIQELNRRLNPFNAVIDKDIDELTRELNASQCQVGFSNHYETDDLHLSVTISNKKQLEKFTHALAKFKYDKLIEILHGKTHAV